MLKQCWLLQAMNEITCAYSQLKEMSLTMEEQKREEDDDGYLTPNDANVYKICPPPRPVNPLCISNANTNGYMAMNNLCGKFKTGSHLIGKN